MKDEEFLEALTEVAKIAKPMHKDTVKVDDMTAPWAEFEVDSLDLLMIGIYMCDLWSVPEEIGKTMQVRNATEMKAFLEQHGQEPADIGAAIGALE